MLNTNIFIFFIFLTYYRSCAELWRGFKGRSQILNHWITDECIWLGSCCNRTALASSHHTSVTSVYLYPENCSGIWSQITSHMHPFALDMMSSSVRNVTCIEDILYLKYNKSNSTVFLFWGLFDVRSRSIVTCIAGLLLFPWQTNFYFPIYQFSTHLCHSWKQHHYTISYK